jgi:hypothetical protein
MSVRDRMANLRSHPSNGRVMAILCCVLWSTTLSILALAPTNEVAVSDPAFAPPPLQNWSARQCYNAGTAKLSAGKLNEAEQLLESSLARQDERVQPPALFNLGHVRFAQGKEELKKSPGGADRQARVATADGTGAIQQVRDALASDDLQQMVGAYIAGRGARKEMRDAMKAVQRAMEAYGKTLVKWQRSLNDFKSAAELNPADTNAIHNAEVVEQAIAKLVDSLREMQQIATKLGGKQSELNQLLKDLKGKIPAANMPPGAPGGEEEEDGDDGKKPSPESLSGLEEADRGGGGREMDLKISPEQAGQLINSLQPDGKQLPMGQGEPGNPKNRTGRVW